MTQRGRIAYLFHVEQTKELARWSSEFGVQLSLDQLGLFQTYLRELSAWTSKTNLTSITQPQEIIVKHFIDSIACSKSFVELLKNSELLDIGSGAGFPGLPLKIVFPELTVTLLEPTSKKIAFLRHMIGTLGLRNLKAIPKTLQAFATDHTSHGTFSYLISRALNMSPIIDHCLELLT
ncbi:MAG: 16S rRNA (guanine(527)-N(7))-methyltransferase RsmG, partial [Nitrospirales bacterium]